MAIPITTPDMIFARTSSAKPKQSRYHDVPRRPSILASDFQGGGCPDDALYIRADLIPADLLAKIKSKAVA